MDEIIGPKQRREEYQAVTLSPIYHSLPQPTKVLSLDKNPNLRNHLYYLFLCNIIIFLE